MMGKLHQQQGASLDIRIMVDPAVTGFIDAHTSALDSAIQPVQMSDAMRRRLTRSNYIFSGIKTFHELNEAFPSLLDENGERKPFERFLNDVQKIDSTYNRNYLRAEYNFVQASAGMAAKWESFMQDGDRYNLQYRTQHDSKVRPEHAELHGVTLPPSDTFWEEYYPPNGWNCRCTVVQVRKSKYPVTPHDDAVALGEAALQRDTKGMFRFNPGIEKKTVPDYNPYTIKRCRDCDIASKLAAFIPDNEVCAACQIVRQCAGDASKSARAIERKHYLHEMEPLLNDKHQKTVLDGTTIKVQFTKDGNEHLFSDTFGRTRRLLKEQLKDLGNILDRATCEDEADPEPGHNNNFEHFYYFIDQVLNIRLNVGKRTRHKSNGQIYNQYILYSINDVR